MAKKQTFADKAKKAKAAGHHHEGEDVLMIVKIRQFTPVGNGFRLTQKTQKITAVNSKEHFGG
jgi:hypothetical protein